MKTFLFIAGIIVILYIFIFIIVMLLLHKLDNKIWKKHGDKGILRMLISSSVYNYHSADMLMLPTGNFIKRGYLPLFFNLTFFEIGGNNITIPPFTKSHKFLKKQFKLLTPIDDISIEISIFGEQVKNI